MMHERRGSAPLNPKPASNGATFQGQQFRTALEAQMATIAYADAWYSAISILPVKSQPTLRLVVGISNSFLPQGAAAVAHRQAWAKMVANISSVIASRPYAHLVSVVGGMEMEIGFSGPARVTPWVQGYGPGPRADFGDAALCPNKNCRNG